MKTSGQLLRADIIKASGLPEEINKLKRELAIITNERNNWKECAKMLYIANMLWSATFQKYQSWLANQVQSNEWPECVVADYNRISYAVKEIESHFNKLKEQK